MVAVRRGFVRHRLLPCSRRRLYRDLIILRSSLHAQHQDTRDDPAPEGHFGTAVPRSLAPSARHTQQEDRVPARLCAIAPDRTSVVEGKRGSVRVDLGGGGTDTKKKN